MQIGPAGGVCRDEREAQGLVGLPGRLVHPHIDQGGVQPEQLRQARPYWLDDRIERRPPKGWRHQGVEELVWPIGGQVVYPLDFK